MVNFNGALLEEDTHFINHKNRGFLQGDVLFEEVRAVNGQLFFWEEHYFRLMASMRILRMDIPMDFTMEFLEEELSKTLKANNLQGVSAIVTLAVYREASNDKSVSFVVSTRPLETPFYTLSDADYEVELFRDYFVNKDMLSQLDTNQKTLEVVAQIFAQENNYADCLLLNSEKQVVGALGGTLFLVSGQNIKTSPLTDGAKNRVLRKVLMALIEDLETYTLTEEAISPFELQKADELFVVSIETGLQPITKYRKKTYDTAVCRDLLGKLNAKIRLTNLK